MPHRDRAGACGTRRFHGAVLPQRRGRRVPLWEVPSTARWYARELAGEGEGTAFGCKRGRPEPGGTEHTVAVEALGGRARHVRGLMREHPIGVLRLEHEEHEGLLTGVASLTLDSVPV